MTTIFDFRPEVAEALANGSLDVGLAEKVRALLRRDVDRIVELIVPLTWVESLTEAEAHTDTVVVEFSRLGDAVGCRDVAHDLDVSPSEFAEARPKGKIPSVQRVVLPS